MADKKTGWFGQMLRVYIREFRLIFSDNGLVLFFLFLPIAYPVIYSLIYNPELVRDVKMVVVDHDRTPLSRELVRQIDATPEAWVTGYAADLDEGRRAVNSHDAYAILEIPEGFARRVGRGEQGVAAIYCEMSLLLRYRGFLVATTNVAQALGSEINAARLDTELPLAGTVATADPLPIENISLGNIENGFDSFIMPGVIILILHQCLILAIGMAGGAKREDPRLTGYNAFNEEPSVLMTMLGQMLCYMTIIALPMIFLVHYVPLMFAFPMAGDTLQIIAFLLPMVIACICLGYVLQGIVLERESIFVIWVVTSVMFLFLSGLTWPRFAMGRVWWWLGSLIPGTWGVEGFIRMNANGSTLAQVSGDYKALWVLAGVYFVAAYCVQRWVMRPVVRRRYAYTPAEAAAIEDDSTAAPQ